MAEEFTPKKTERSFRFIRKHGWIIAFIIGLGGQFIPEIGLLVPLVILTLLGMSLFKGMYWCGNFCFHGSFFDQLVMKISPHKKVPDIFKSKTFVGLILILFILNFSRQLYFAITGDTGTVLARVGSVMANTYLVVILIGLFLGIVINSRTWCHFCPMGTLEKFMYKIGKKTGLTKNYDQKVTITEPEDCIECGLCSRVCPFELRPYPTLKENALADSSNNQYDEERCIRCRVCIENCPADVLTLATEDEAKKLN